MTNETEDTLLQLERINSELERRVAVAREQSREHEAAFMLHRRGQVYQLVKRLVELAHPTPPSSPPPAGDAAYLAQPWIPEAIARLGRRNLALAQELMAEWEAPARLDQRARTGNELITDRLVNFLVWGDWRARGMLLEEVSAVVRERLERYNDPPRPPSPDERLATLVAELFGSRAAALLPELRAYSERPKLALSLAGGMGDGVWLTAVADAMRQKYPRAQIFVFSTNAQFVDVFARHRAVHEVLVPDDPRRYHLLGEAMALLLARGSFDAWFECKYVTRVHYSPFCRLPAQDRAETDAAFAELRLNFEPFPLGNNALSLAAASAGLDLLGLVARSARLDLAAPRPTVMPSAEDTVLLDVVRRLGDYVTIHHGCDPRMAVAGQPRQTKNWIKERWEELIAHVTARTGLGVLQLGTDQEERLAGAEHLLMGRARLSETALVLKHARLHIDTEGGLVHLARAVGTRAVVLFGPTPIEFFGYRQNTNLRSGDCHSCWWSTPDWFSCCPRGLVTPACIEALTPATVAAAVEEALAAPPLESHAQLSAVSYFDDRTVRDGYDELVAISARNDTREQVGANWRYLQALAERRARFGAQPIRVLVTASGRTPLPLTLARGGDDAHLCLLAPADAAAIDRSDEARFLEELAGRVPFAFGSPFHLPYEPGAFDLVIAADVPREPRAGRYALGELLRVTRPDGLVWTSLRVADGAPSAGAPEWTERELEELLATIGLAYRHQPHAIQHAAHIMNGELEPTPTVESRAAMRRFTTVAAIAVRKLLPKPARPPARERYTRHEIDGVELLMSDYASSYALPAIVEELRGDCYRLAPIQFAPGDVVLDVGGHVGAFSIFLAKKYPFLKVVAFEPFPDNYRHFLENIRLNEVSNVVVYNRAVTSDGRRITMSFDLDNTGGATAEPLTSTVASRRSAEVESVTLEEMLQRHAPSGCKLLKIDCEGAEFEVLPATPSLTRVEYLSGEFHMSERLRAAGQSIEALTAYCQKHVKPENVVVVPNVIV
jgi:FkbM family methyltransferase